MSAKNNLSRITIDVPKNYHRKLKSIAALTGKSMKDIVMQAIESIDEECLYSNHSVNKKTLKVLEDIENNKDLIEAKDAQDLFKKLGI